MADNQDIQRRIINRARELFDQGLTELKKSGNNITPELIERIKQISLENSLTEANLQESFASQQNILIQAFNQALQGDRTNTKYNIIDDNIQADLHRVSDVTPVNPDDGRINGTWNYDISTATSTNTEEVLRSQLNEIRNQTGDLDDPNSYKTENGVRIFEGSGGRQNDVQEDDPNQNQLDQLQTDSSDSPEDLNAQQLQRQREILSKGNVTDTDEDSAKTGDELKKSSLMDGQPEENQLSDQAKQQKDEVQTLTNKTTGFPPLVSVGTNSINNTKQSTNSELVNHNDPLSNTIALGSSDPETAAAAEKAFIENYGDQKARDDYSGAKDEKPASEMSDEEIVRKYGSDKDKSKFIDSKKPSLNSPEFYRKGKDGKAEPGELKSFGLKIPDGRQIGGIPESSNRAIAAGLASRVKSGTRSFGTGIKNLGQKIKGNSPANSLRNRTGAAVNELGNVVKNQAARILAQAAISLLPWIAGVLTFIMIFILILIVMIIVVCKAMENPVGATAARFAGVPSDFKKICANIPGINICEIESTNSKYGPLEYGSPNGILTAEECGEVKKFLPYINEASNMYGIPAPIIAGIMSRETRVGTIINGCGGYGDGGYGHGLGQIDPSSGAFGSGAGPNQPVGKATIFKDKNGKNLVWSDCRDGIVFIAYYLDTLANQQEARLNASGVSKGSREFWRQIFNTYNSGDICQIGTDSCTTGLDYGSDVLARADDANSCLQTIGQTAFIDASNDWKRIDTVLQIGTGVKVLAQSAPTSYANLSEGHKKFLSEIASQAGYVAYQDTGTLSPDLQNAFNAMSAKARAENINLSIVSGYRSYDDQVSTYFTGGPSSGRGAKIQQYWSESLTGSELEAVRQQYLTRAQNSAPPGYSEHSTGLAIDINSTELSFENTPEYRWLLQNAESFGFELSYGENSTKGAGFEPWHWRFVGNAQYKNSTPLETLTGTGNQSQNSSGSVPQDQCLCESNIYTTNLSNSTSTTNNSSNAVENGLDLSQIAEQTGVQSIVVAELGSENNIQSYNGDQAPASPASSIKLVIADLVLQKIASGEIDLNQQLTVTRDVNSNESESPIGSSMTVEQALEQMLQRSSNTTTNLLVKALGGPGASINGLLQTSGYGSTQFNSYLSLASGSGAVGSNTSTALDISRAMNNVFQSTTEGSSSAVEALKNAKDTFSHSNRVANKIAANSNVIGNSAVVFIDGKSYIITSFANQNGILPGYPNDKYINESTQAVVDALKSGKVIVPNASYGNSSPSQTLNCLNPSQLVCSDGNISQATQVNMQEQRKRLADLFRAGYIFSQDPFDIPNILDGGFKDNLILLMLTVYDSGFTFATGKSNGPQRQYGGHGAGEAMDFMAFKRRNGQNILMTYSTDESDEVGGQAISKVWRVEENATAKADVTAAVEVMKSTGVLGGNQLIGPDILKDQGVVLLGNRDVSGHDDHIHFQVDSTSQFTGGVCSPGQTTSTSTTYYKPNDKLIITYNYVLA